MNKKLLLVFSVLLCFGIVLFYAQKSDSKILGGNPGGKTWNFPAVVVSGDKKKHLAKPAYLLFKEFPAVLYSDYTGVFFQYKDKTIPLKLSANATNVWLKNEGDNIYAFWWTKGKEGKHLYFKGSNDNGQSFGDMVTINTSNGVLPEISIAAHESKIAVAYTDERLPVYQIYVNVSTDSGKTWQKQDYRLDSNNILPKVYKENVEAPKPFALHPMLVYLDDGALLVTWEQKKLVDGEYVMQFVSRASHDYGISWKEEQEIHRSNSAVTVEYRTVSDGKNVVLLAAIPKKGLVSYLSHSKDLSVWENTGSAPGTSDVNFISWIKAAISNDVLKVGYIVERTTDTKYSVETTSLNFSTKKWDEKPFRMDRNKKSKIETKATYLDLGVMPDGEFVMVWQDHRDIMPAFYVDFTSESGKKWQTEATPITLPGYVEARNPNLMIGKDVWVLGEWYVPVDESSVPRLGYKVLPFDKEKKHLVKLEMPELLKLSDDELKKRLAKRAKEFMEYRVKGDWEEVWNYLDPIYTRGTQKKSWLYKQGKINYQEFTLDKIDISDFPFGKTLANIKYVLPEQVIQGQKMAKSDGMEGPIEMKWLWLYDEWYFTPTILTKRHLSY